MLSSFLFSSCLPQPQEHQKDTPPIFVRGRARKAQVRRSGHHSLPQYEVALNKLLKFSPTPPAYSLHLPSSLAPSDHTEPPNKNNQLEDLVTWLEGRPGIDPAEGELAPQRARRKRQQVANLILPCRLYLDHLFASSTTHTHTTITTTTIPSQKITVVEFCCGSGHIALPLAALYPSVAFLLMDNRSASIKQAGERARKAGLENVTCRVQDIYTFSPLLSENENEVKVHFHLGIALHACGTLTDMAIEYCLQQRAAFVVCPCCVGKVTATGGTKEMEAHKRKIEEEMAIIYPRSMQFRALFPDRKQYEALASAGDVSVRQFRKANEKEDGGGGGRKNETENAKEKQTTQEEQRRRRLCKSFLEMDRGLRAEEEGYRTRLMLLTPRECTPKNDLLFSHPREWEEGGRGARLKEGEEKEEKVYIDGRDSEEFDTWFGDPWEQEEEEEEDEEDQEGEGEQEH